jgi:predicted DNA-binding protein
MLLILIFTRRVIMAAFKRYSLCVDEKTYNAIKTISDTTGNSIAEVSRDLIEKGLATEWVDENVDLISSIVRKQMEAVLKPHVERLAKLSSKSGHMSATAAFLNVQAFQDLVPVERKKDVVSLYSSARKKAAEYMKIKAEDWDKEERL